MPTVRDILDSLRFERIVGRDEGSCFGVTDPNRLRKPFHPHHEPQPPICEGCREGRKVHRCKKRVPYLKIVVVGEVIKKKAGTVKCVCPTCKKKDKKSRAK